MKVLGQRHMRRKYPTLPPQIGDKSKRQTVGIIGCGNFSFTTIAYFLENDFGNVIGACMDIDINKAASYSRQFRVPLYTTDANDIINDPDIQFVYIASNHATHAEYAIRALDAGKNIYIEKPHVVNDDQLHRLHAAMLRSHQKAFIGFNRPGSRFGQLINKYCSTQDGAGMYNWFVAGHALADDHWYYRDGEGGRVLGNLSHWTDFTLRLVPPDNAFPVTIMPTRHLRSDTDIAVTFLFADGTIAAITFSSKGQTFEGVRESLRAQKGDILVTMDNFKRMTVEIGDKKRIFNNRFYDHGHRANIVSAYRNIYYKEFYDREKAIGHITNTAWLFLRAREAMELNRRITVDSYVKTLAGSNIFPAAESPGNQAVDLVSG
jgi:predicted dehydrogenase